MTSVTPFLMFQGDAEEALALYVELVPDSRVLHLERYGPEGPGAEGSVAMAEVELAGLRVRALDSPVQHAFGFTPSLSLFVECSGVEEVDRLAKALSAGGEVRMPAADHGFSRRFAWVDDRYGVSWQLNAA